MTENLWIFYTFFPVPTFTKVSLRQSLIQFEILTRTNGFDNSIPNFFLRLICRRFTAWLRSRYLRLRRLFKLVIAMSPSATPRSYLYVYLMDQQELPTRPARIILLLRRKFWEIRERNSRENEVLDGGWLRSFAFLGFFLKRKFNQLETCNFGCITFITKPKNKKYQLVQLKVNNLPFSSIMLRSTATGSVITISYEKQPAE